MHPFLKKLGSLFNSGTTTPDTPRVEVIPAPKPRAQSQDDSFKSRIEELWRKIDFCASEMKAMGWLPLEDSFISEMALGLMPNPLEGFIGSAQGRYLKNNDEPPRNIVFLGVIASQGGAYFTAGFFHDDGKMMNVIGFTTIDELYDYLQKGAPLDVTPDESKGVLGRASKWLGNEDKITPPKQLPAPKP